MDPRRFDAWTKTLVTAGTSRRRLLALLAGGIAAAPGPPRGRPAPALTRTTDDDGRHFPGQRCCGGTCTAVADDPKHCGGCAAVCPKTKPDCCGTTCVDSRTDATHCGDCATVCPKDQKCRKGKCL